MGRGTVTAEDVLYGQIKTRLRPSDFDPALAAFDAVSVGVVNGFFEGKENWAGTQLWAIKTPRLPEQLKKIPKSEESRYGTGPRRLTRDDPEIERLIDIANNEDVSWPGLIGVQLADSDYQDYLQFLTPSGATRFIDKQVLAVLEIIAAEGEKWKYDKHFDALLFMKDESPQAFIFCQND